jgi:hypothetical protein
VSIVSIEKDYERLSLELIAEFDAPIAAVWQLWADPRKLERWWGPPTHPATVVDHELTVGGAVSYFMTGPEGEKERLENWGAFDVFPQSVAQMDAVLATHDHDQEVP